MGDGLRSSSQDEDVVASKKSPVLRLACSGGAARGVGGPPCRAVELASTAADAAAAEAAASNLAEEADVEDDDEEENRPAPARALALSAPHTAAPPAAPACRLTASRIARPPGWERASLRRSMEITKDITTLNYLMWGGKARHAPR